MIFFRAVRSAPFGVCQWFCSFGSESQEPIAECKKRFALTQSSGGRSLYILLYIVGVSVRTTLTIANSIYALFGNSTKAKVITNICCNHVQSKHSLPENGSLCAHRDEEGKRRWTKKHVIAGSVCFPSPWLQFFIGLFFVILMDCIEATTRTEPLSSAMETWSSWPLQIAPGLTVFQIAIKLNELRRGKLVQSKRCLSSSESHYTFRLVRSSTIDYF